MSGEAKPSSINTLWHPKARRLYDWAGEVLSDTQPETQVTLSIEGSPLHVVERRMHTSRGDYIPRTFGEAVLHTIGKPLPTAYGLSGELDDNKFRLAMRPYIGRPGVRVTADVAHKPDRFDPAPKGELLSLVSSVGEMTRQENIIRVENIDSAAIANNECYEALIRCSEGLHEGVTANAIVDDRGYEVSYGILPPIDPNEVGNFLILPGGLDVQASVTLRLFDDMGEGSVQGAVVGEGEGFLDQPDIERAKRVIEAAFLNEES